MQLTFLKTTTLLLLLQPLASASAIAIPSTEDIALSQREVQAESNVEYSDNYDIEYDDEYSDEEYPEEQNVSPADAQSSKIHTFLQVLTKRRGGGGGGRGGGGGGGGGGRGSSGSSSTNTGVRGGGTTSASPYYTRGGSGVYAGGSATPYRAGSVLPTSGLAPRFLFAGALGFGAGALLFAGHPFYYYGPYGYRYPYYNNQTRQNNSLPVSCVCAQYNPCGCDDINSADVVDQELDDGTANITTINGTQSVIINGTLDNGTDGSGAAGRLVGGLVKGGLMKGVWGTATLVVVLGFAL